MPKSAEGGNLEETPDDGPLVFKEESEVSPNPPTHVPRPWKVLIVDDEESIHELTQLVLKYFVFDGKPLEFHSAYSGAEARRLLAENDDFAIILLDVVMESENSGLEVVQFIRGTLKNSVLRIILRTGQPGSAPEDRIITEYDINDYKEKSDLTKQKLFTSMTTALRSYRDITSIQKSREELHKIINASASIFQLQSMKNFCQAVLQQLSYLLNIESPALYVQVNGFAATLKEEDFVILAATGVFSDHVDQRLNEVMPPSLVAEIRHVLETRSSQYRNNWYIAYFEAESRMKNLICIEFDRPLDPMVFDLVQIFNMDVGIAFNNLYLNKEVVDTQKELIFKLGEIVESRSQETSYHVRRVGEYVQLMFEKMGSTTEEAENYRMAAAMHDIGKLGIPDRILMKPDKLSEEEYELMKSHTLIGYELMKSSERLIFLKAAEIALSHHERWDGSGYPHGLKGEAIPLAARVTSVADVFDALSTKRVYRNPWEDQVVFDYVRDEAGKAFDPEVVELFLGLKEEILAIRSKYERGPTVA